jgi:hypothetical protein
MKISLTMCLENYLEKILKSEKETRKHKKKVEFWTLRFKREKKTQKLVWKVRRTNKLNKLTLKDAI